MAERLGHRPTQEDAAFVDHVKNAEAKDNLQRFYGRKVAELKEKYKSQSDGTTLCSVTYDSDNEKFHICNVGDSRAFLKLILNNGELITLSLTEDQKPSTARFREEIKRQGGAVYSSRAGGALRVCGNLATAGAIGDKDVAKFLVMSDIRSVDLKTILDPLGLKNYKKHIKDIDLFLVCDGVTDVLFTTYETYESDGKYQLRLVDQKSSSLKEMTSDNLKNASTLVEAALKKGSTDNITAIQVPIMTGGQMMRYRDPVMATVCDGHGGPKSVASREDLTSTKVKQNFIQSIAYQPQPH